MYKKIASLLSLVSLILIMSIPQAQAEDLAVSQNGSASANNLSESSTNNTSASSSNNAQVTNNSTSNSSSGENQALNNTGGDTNISSGGTSSSIEIKNNVNGSNTDIGCCPPSQPNSTTISGNGSGSTNNASSVSTNTTSVTISQNATITNNINSNASSGLNSASSNNGNVSIQTGNALVTSQVINVSNNSYISVSGPKNSTTTVKISGNGANSYNNVVNNETRNTKVTQENNAYITNLLKTYANSGGNTANYNNGDVKIKTGSATIDYLIQNYVNKNIVKIICECLSKVEAPPTGGPTPPTETNSPPNSSPPLTSSPPGQNGGGPGGGGPRVLGYNPGPNLPNTGDNTLLYLTLGLILLFLIGLKLTITPTYNPAWVFNRRTCKIYR